MSSYNLLPIYMLHFSICSVIMCYPFWYILNAFFFQLRRNKIHGVGVAGIVEGPWSFCWVLNECLFYILLVSVVELRETKRLRTELSCCMYFFIFRCVELIPFNWAAVTHCCCVYSVEFIVLRKLIAVHVMCSVCTVLSTISFAIANRLSVLVLWV